MPDKALAYAQMAEETAKQITGSYQRWTAFLTTAARVYKYPYLRAKSSDKKLEIIDSTK